MNKVKEPLYRKENKRVRRCGSYLDFGGEHRHERHTKSSKRLLEEGVTRGSMNGNVQRGLDYTPLYRFLLSNVGQDWPAVHSEAVSRLDRTDPIFHMVAIREEDREMFFRAGETSYYSGLYVDDQNKLQKVKPDLCSGDINKECFGCTCCTYTLNGIPYMTQATIDAVTR
jgi:hypothetical protein